MIKIETKFSNIKNKYFTKSQQHSNQEKIINNEFKTGMDILSKEDRCINYKKWIIAIGVLCLIAELFISQSLYSDYRHAYIQISEILIIFLFFIPMLLILRLLRIIGKLQSRIIDYKD